MNEAIENALGRAAEALRSARCDDGLWRDFQTLAGEACDWVTAFVAFATARCEALQDAVHESIRHLYYRQRPNGGWAYNDEVPSDCDSTAWFLLAASTTTQWRPSAIRRATAYVRSHWNDEGRGFCTYNRDDGIDRYIEVPPDLTAGWTSVHPCVTAVALQSLMIHGTPSGASEVGDAIAALLESQDEDGLWSSYWWRGPAYGTYHVLRALCLAEALNVDVWSRARDGLIAQQRADGGWGGGAFPTAMCMLALMLRPDEAALQSIRSATTFLLQSESGGLWPAAPILRIPAPMTRNPPPEESWPADILGTETVVTDQRSVFTAAAAQWALSVAREVL